MVGRGQLRWRLHAFPKCGTHDGKTIDAKVSSSVFGDATFVFHAPNYKVGATQPSGDIGFLYQTNSAGSAEFDLYLL
ncbi:hypothetical protein OK016_20485 [Vibrio chagasii]|nr:hypothetical protein [Vibrio chagasii]